LKVKTGTHHTRHPRSRRNVPMVVDFRQMYATALEGWLDVDAEPILGPGFEAQAVFT